MFLSKYVVFRELIGSMGNYKYSVTLTDNVLVYMFENMHECLIAFDFFKLKNVHADSKFQLRLYMHKHNVA